jgi:hypothetical protein
LTEYFRSKKKHPPPWAPQGSRQRPLRDLVAVQGHDLGYYYARGARVKDHPGRPKSISQHAEAESKERLLHGHEDLAAAGKQGVDSCYRLAESVFFEHHFGGLDDGRDFIADLQLHFIDAALGNYALHYVLADLHYDVRHYAAKLNFKDFAFETISR